MPEPDLIVILSLHKICSAALACSVLLSPTAKAGEDFAQIQAFTGKILINGGQGFEQAVAATPLKKGDRVLISAKSSITIHYLTAGCLTTFKTPSLVKIAKTAPCEGELISNSIGTAPIVAPIGAGISAAAAGTGAAAGIPLVGWGVALVLDPIIPASLP